MEMLLIQPEDKKQQVFLYNLMDRLNLKWKKISEESIEDAALLKLMLEADPNDTVQEEEIMKTLAEV